MWLAGTLNQYYAIARFPLIHFLWGFYRLTSDNQTLSVLRIHLVNINEVDQNNHHIQRYVVGTMFTWPTHRP